MKKNIAIIAVLSISIIVFGVNTVKNLDYKAIEMITGETVLVVRPVVIDGIRKH